MRVAGDPERTKRTTGIAVAGGIGGLAGAALAGPGRRTSRRVLGAAAGAALLAGSEALARRRQRPGEIPGVWHRILVSGALAAPLGWA
ncbi:MAG TPA: hypothetical protein VK360_00515, partial [Acidimicrobiales bacterium]|nr:hypothetical protein [Acidimicrobiales bacterium]